nr:MAG TPA: hypothetical protein [Caudoviricetes sp.]
MWIKFGAPSVAICYVLRRELCGKFFIAILGGIKPTMLMHGNQT